MPRVILAIESECPRGKGVPGDPFRSVTQYHTPSGELLAESDPVAEEVNREGGQSAHAPGQVAEAECIDMAAEVKANNLDAEAIRQAIKAMCPGNLREADLRQKAIDALPRLVARVNGAAHIQDYIENVHRVLDTYGIPGGRSSDKPILLIQRVQDACRANQTPTL